MPAVNVAALSEVAVDAAALGDNILVPSVALKGVRVFKLFLVFDGATVVTFRSGDGDGVALSGPISMLAGGSIVLDFDGYPWFTSTAGLAFIIHLQTAVQVSGRVYYLQAK